MVLNNTTTSYWRPKIKKVFDKIINNTYYTGNFRPPLLEEISCSSNPYTPIDSDLQAFVDPFWNIPIDTVTANCSLTPMSVNRLLDICEIYLNNHPQDSRNSDPSHGMFIVVIYTFRGQINDEWEPV
jgi:hypothetical protein